MLEELQTETPLNSKTNGKFIEQYCDDNPDAADCRVYDGE